MRGGRCSCAGCPEKTRSPLRMWGLIQSAHGAREHDPRFCPNVYFLFFAGMVEGWASSSVLVGRPSSGGLLMMVHASTE